MKEIKIFIISLIVSIIPLLSIAQSDTLNLPKEWKQLGLEDIDKSKTARGEGVVSASRSRKKIEDIPVTVYVIKKEEIQRNGWVTLVDVLKHAPGIRVSQPGSGEEGETFMMRGLLGNEYAKILINSVPVSPSVSSGMPLGAQLPIRQAERIEIIYGPASSIYGADATSGVINIVTQNVEPANYSDASLVMGTNNYQFMNFTVGGKAGKNKNVLKYMIYGSSYKYSDINVIKRYEDLYKPFSYYAEKRAVFNLGSGSVAAEDMTEEMINAAGIPTKSVLPLHYKGSFTKPEMDEIGQTSSMMGAELRFRNISFTYQRMARQDFSSVGTTSFLYLYDNPDIHIGEVINKYTLAYTKNTDKTSLSATLSYNQYRMDDNSGYGITYDPVYSRTYKFAASDDIFSEVIGTYNPNEHIEALAGLTYQYSGGLPETNDLYERFEVENYKPFNTAPIASDAVFGSFGFNPILIQNISAFGQIHFNFSRLNVVLGYRRDHNSKYGTSIDPRLAVLLKLTPSLSLRSSYGEAFKAPSPSTMYKSEAYQDPKQGNKIAYYFIPNTDLKPEKLKSYEIGLKFTKPNFSIDLSGFYNILSNRIILGLELDPLDPAKYPNAVVPSPPFHYVSTYRNIESESFFYGLQLTAIAKEIYQPIKLGASFDLSVSKGRERIISEYVDFRQTPKVFMQGQINFEPLQAVVVSLDYVYSSNWIKQYLNSPQDANTDYGHISGYHVFDAGVNYLFNKHFTASIKVLNVFDKKYGGISATGTESDLRYNPQQLRNVRLGLTYHFD